MQYWLVIRGQIRHILVGFRWLYVYAICRHDCARSCHSALMEYWAELIWNIASLFGRQTVSVSCSCRWQILRIWSGSGAVED